jgi:WD40 repeat protein
LIRANPAGKTLVSASKDETIKLWDLPAAKKVGR